MNFKEKPGFFPKPQENPPQRPARELLDSYLKCVKEIKESREIILIVTAEAKEENRALTKVDQETIKLFTDAKRAALKRLKKLTGNLPAETLSQIKKMAAPRIKDYRRAAAIKSAAQKFAEELDTSRNIKNPPE